MKKIELLAPAKDLECGKTAIDCGADAVYMGGPYFGAREAAANSIEDIAAMVKYAHPYWANVYVTINTILKDEEVLRAVNLIKELYQIGVDGVLIQDVGLLECDLPAIPLIASTQIHNASPQQVAFLQKAGFKRAVLARELDLGQIRAIRQAAPDIELEFFVHGALCVGYSGQCYLSYCMGGRSANRGVCAQPCRKPYHLVDKHGLVRIDGKYLLSLADLNLSSHLGLLLDNGITSFKIEGRLKDKNYVANTTAFYRAEIDKILKHKKMARSSSGSSKIGFVPDVNKTFNRGYTTSYFLFGRRKPVGQPLTPKMTGEAVGKVKAVTQDGLVLETAALLKPGDGISFFDQQMRLCGTSIETVKGKAITVTKKQGLFPGTVIFRNHDHEFLSSLARSPKQRAIAVKFILRTVAGGLELSVRDEDGNEAMAIWKGKLEPAENADKALANISSQLKSTGGTIFRCDTVEAHCEPVCFLRTAELNSLRRDALKKLADARVLNRPKKESPLIPNAEPYFQKDLTYQGNVLNRWARAFYQRHGVSRMEPAAEAGKDMAGHKVMMTRYCLKYDFGLCQKMGSKKILAEPLFLIDEEGHKLRLEFDCKRCGMNIFLEKPSHTGHPANSGQVVKNTK